MYRNNYGCFIEQIECTPNLHQTTSSGNFQRRRYGRRNACPYSNRNILVPLHVLTLWADNRFPLDGLHISRKIRAEARTSRKHHLQHAAASKRSRAVYRPTRYHIGFFLTRYPLTNAACPPSSIETNRYT